MNESDNKELIKEILKELESMGILKKKSDSFKATESILYSYPAIKESIKQRNQQISDLKKYGIPKKSKSITVMSENKVQIEENDLLDVTIKNIKKSIIKTKVVLNYIDKVLAKYSADSYYEIFRLKYFEKKTIDEIAEYYEKDVSTINRNKKRLINDLKVYLMPNDIITDILGY